MNKKFNLYYASGWKLVIPIENGPSILAIFHFFKKEGFIPKWYAKCDDHNVKICFEFLTGAVAEELNFYMKELCRAN